MRKIMEVLRLHFDAKLSNETVAGSLKISKGNVFNILWRFQNAGLSWPINSEITELQLEKKLYPNTSGVLTSIKLKIKPDYAHIAKEAVKPHTTLQLLYEEFQDENPECIGRSVFYSDFRTYLKKHKLSMNQIHKGGDKLFIDYSGDSKDYVDRETGEIATTEMFVSSFGASSYCYVEFTHSQKKEDWVKSHVRMYEYFNCVAAALVPDNLKSGITKASLYDPDFNPLYYEMAKHYDSCILPARVRKPKDKAIVESNVLHLQRYILGRFRNRTFFSLDELNFEATKLLNEFNNRPMKDYGGQSRKERFLELDQPYSKSLPAKRFTINKMKENILVGNNYCVKFDSHYYSVPHILVKERVTIYSSGNIIEIYHKGEHVVRHEKGEPNFSYTTVTDHMPANHKHINDINPSWLIFKGGEIGPHTSEAIKTILGNRYHPEIGYKFSMGVLRMATKYSPERLEMACQRAAHFNSISYRSIKTILEKSLDKQILIEETKPTKSSPSEFHDNLRGQDYYS